MQEKRLNVKRNCVECGKSITFKEFCRDNPAVSEKRAELLWTTSYISVFCPDCFFQCQERPFKSKRGYDRWKLRSPSWKH